MNAPSDTAADESSEYYSWELPDGPTRVRISVEAIERILIEGIRGMGLLPKRGGGIVPAVELVTGVLPLAVMIREDKLYQLPNLMQRGRAFGMIRFDDGFHMGRLDDGCIIIRRVG
jgi:Tfp pilus assembly pilus retraction ATPase PilT